MVHSTSDDYQIIHSTCVACDYYEKMNIAWVSIIVLLQVVILDWHYQVRVPLTAILPISLVVGLALMMWLDDLSIVQLLTKLAFKKPKSKAQPTAVRQERRTESEGQLTTVGRLDDVFPPTLADEIPEPLKPIILGGIDIIKYTSELFTNPQLYGELSRSSNTQPMIEQPNIELLD
jgi:hypothetical protein